MSTPLTINSVETLEQALPIIRKAQELYSTFSQEQVDAICEKSAMAVSKMRIPLAKMACEETGYGIMVDKVTKNQYASEHVLINFSLQFPVSITTYSHTSPGKKVPWHILEPKHSCVSRPFSLAHSAYSSRSILHYKTHFPIIWKNGREFSLPPFK